jgi:hypothetical protein
VTIAKTKKTQSIDTSISSLIEDKEKTLLLLEMFINHLKKDHSYSEEKIQQLLEKKKQEVKIPSSIFNKKLSSFESIVKYLHENKDLQKNKIAELLGRNPRTIWTTYNNATKKQKSKLKLSKKETHFIPVKIFSQRKTSILETLISYLKENQRLELAEISEILKREKSTIWTAYKRYQNKK